MNDDKCHLLITNHEDDYDDKWHLLITIIEDE